MWRSYVSHFDAVSLQCGFEPSDLIGVRPLHLPRIRDGEALSLNSPACLIWTATAKLPPINRRLGRRFKYLSIALATAGARRWAVSFPWIRCGHVVLGPYETAMMCAEVEKKPDLGGF
jgi:hypothetical protein